MRRQRARLTKHLVKEGRIGQLGQMMFVNASVSFSKGARELLHEFSRS